MLLSLLYPGAQTSLASLQPAVRELRRLLPVSFRERHRILLRLDGGFGDDHNLHWLMPQGYQVLAKGYSGKRAAAYANRVRPANWLEVAPGQRWLAWSPTQLAFSRPTRTVAVRWLTPKGQYRHALYLTTLTALDLADLAHLYDDRGQMEVEIKADKHGLLLAHRHQHTFAAQEMLVLLNDWVHNFLAWFRFYALKQSRFADFGPKRIVRDLFAIPAQATLVNQKLLELHLKQSHPYATDMAACLNRLWHSPDYF